jgi:hypothetical protein
VRGCCWEFVVRIQSKNGRSKGIEQEKQKSKIHRLKIVILDFLNKELKQL